MGNPRWITADLIDLSADGVGILLTRPLRPGDTINAHGRFSEAKTEGGRLAKVGWCRETGAGGFRAGLQFVRLAAGPSASGEHPKACVDVDEPDHYELMQLSPNADAETIDRVYRLLAQRYHPDNSQTGSSEVFVRLSEAHRILSDPARRAQYDVGHRQARRLHWKIFDQPASATGREAERRKRRGILDLLYAKAAHDPDRGSMTSFEFEELLGVPREHLAAALWYLKGKGWVQRTDHGRYSITIPGFDAAEEQPPLTESTPQLLLQSPTSVR